MSVEWKASAAKDLEGLERTIQEEVLRRVLLAETNPSHFLKRLAGRPYYKLRCGDYRVFVDWQKNKNLLSVLRVAHRKNAYNEKLV